MDDEGDCGGGVDEKEGERGKMKGKGKGGM